MDPKDGSVRENNHLSSLTLILTLFQKLPMVIRVKEYVISKI